MIALLLLAAPNLSTLRAHATSAADAAARAHATSAERLAKREAAEKNLAAAKADLDAGRGGWFGERRVRQQSAAVRQLAEEYSAAETVAREDDAALEASREALREGLFADAGERTAAGDALARAGRVDEAQLAYRDAWARLAEAAELPSAPASDDPWTGLDAEIPLSPDMSPSERASVAAAYLRSADLVQARLGELRARHAAVATAATAWARLSRFRGVLERGGAPPSDPAPERDRLAAQIEAGEKLEAKLRGRAKAVAP